jgi:hypothetical protein
MDTRFEMDASTEEEVRTYFVRRAYQAFIDGIVPESTELEALTDSGTVWGVRAFARAPDGERLQTFYPFANHRGHGHTSRYLASNPPTVVTTPDCNIETYLQRKGVPFRVVGAITATVEYRAIEQFYGVRTARRSGVELMNHIDEGLAILVRRQAHEELQRAFCLHPLVQADVDLARHFPRISEFTKSASVLALAIEYRNVANATLSNRSIAGASDIPLSPLAGVNEMLVADKIQNFKDFLLHHRATHPRRRELTSYFVNWLNRLGVTRETFSRWFVELQLFPPREPLENIRAFLAHLDC